MKIRQLITTNFRNFDALNIQFSDRLNIFVGQNGNGKTNILEAIYFLIEGDSFRYSRYDTLIQENKNEAYLRCLLENKDLDYSLKINLTAKTKTFLLNDKKVSQSNVPLPPLILFSPESLNSIKESSDHRRQLLDQILVQTFSYGKKLVNEFKKALKTRNKILKDILQEKIDREMGIKTLESVNPIFIRLAAELTFMRLEALKNIKPEVQKSLHQIHTENQAEFDYSYIISEQSFKEVSKEKIEEFLLKRLTELSFAELKSGTSLIGPQKHDVLFLYNGKDSRFFCSQGQQRSIILAFKMAQIVYHHRVHGFYPVLLLDDVLSELDLAKQESLISTLNQIETQTFVTTTDTTFLKKLHMEKSQVFHVSQGAISTDC
ncbi:MAG: DNA replication and repair protein RecF [Bdellovibrio sp.]|nr:DNA replication and repair protein RecF [Bdellovibrio sp.]